MKIGDRIAQLIIEKISDTHLVEVDALSETARGEGGFASTGISINDLPATQKRYQEEHTQKQVGEQSLKHSDFEVCATTLAALLNERLIDDKTYASALDSVQTSKAILDLVSQTSANEKLL